MWFAMALFFHVLGVVILFATVSLIVVCEARMRASQRAAQLREWADLANISSKSLAGVSMIVLVPALYLVPQGWSFTTPWVLAALITFVMLAVLGARVTGPRVEAIQRAAAAQIDDVVPASLHERTCDPTLQYAKWTRIALLVWFLFLMTNKPDLAGILLSLGAALLAGVLLNTFATRLTVVARRPRSASARTLN
jgi:uncharacterized membrane protein